MRLHQIPWLLFLAAVALAVLWSIFVRNFCPERTIVAITGPCSSGEPGIMAPSCPVLWDDGATGWQVGAIVGLRMRVCRGEAPR